jgi:hypothetical protein
MHMTMHIKFVAFQPLLLQSGVRAGLYAAAAALVAAGAALTGGIARGSQG